jgi:beta-glucosidase
MVKRISVITLLALAAFITVALFTPWLIGETRGKQTASQIQADYPLSFPSEFSWGVAVAAQHVEHQQPSDWTAFERRVIREGKTDTGDQPGQAKPGHIRDLDTVSAEVRQKKVDFDNRYESDFQELAKLGLNSYRFSLSWARLFPRAEMKAPDPEGIAFYQDVIAAAKANGLAPHVSLFHFSTPEWFWEERDGKRGWERPDALEHWNRYVSAVSKFLGPEINHWCTLNEPMVYALWGYIEGVFPPLEQRAGPIDVAPVVAQLLRAHADAYQILHADADARGQAIAVGLTQHTRAFEPWRNWHPLDRLSAGFVQQAFIWDVFDAIESGTYAMANTDFTADIEGLAGTQDYVGINYYGRFYVQMDIDAMAAGPVTHTHDPSDPDELTSDLGWALYPIGFSTVLNEAWQRYGKPIQILENGIADAGANDTLRQTFLVSHLREVWYAMNVLGIDIDGYFHWSHLDNFEWAEGFNPRFGLFAVDYENAFTRTARPSAAVYADIIGSGINEAMWQRTRGPF